MIFRRSRWTGKNILRAAAAFLFAPFTAYYTLIIGLASRKWKIIAEGAAYAIVFSAMIALPSSTLGALPAFLGIGAMIASGVRTYQLRDLWLPRPGSPPQQKLLMHPPPYSQLGTRPFQGFPAQQLLTMAPQNVRAPVPRTPAGPPPAAQPPAASAAFQPPTSKPAPPGLPDDLSVSVDWVSSTAKRNKQRLPSDAYITILETSQELGALIDAEQKNPSRDPAFEYELEAMASRYLPAVLKGYLAIPPALTDQVQPNGKTPDAELVEQLELLSGQTSALYASRHSNATAQLTTTGNFLRERFGHQRKDAFDFGVE